MRNIRFFAISFHVVALTSLLVPSTIAQRTEDSLKVVSVMAGDALKVEKDGVEMLMLLYGIKCPGFQTSAGREAKKITEDKVIGEGARISIEEEKGSLVFVTVHIEGGAILNEQLLLSGLAEWDKLSAPNNTEYESLEARAKERGVGLWKHLNRGLPSESDGVKKSKTVIDLDSFKNRRNLVKRAQFDIEYNHWASLSQAEREGVRSLLIDSLESGLTARQQRIEGHAGIVQNISAMREAIQRKIHEENVAEESELSDVLDDFDLQWNSGMLDSFVEDLEVYSVTNDRYMAEIVGELATEYAVRTSRDQARVRSEAQGVSRLHEANRRALKAKEASVAGEQVRSQNLLSIASREQEAHYRRWLSKVYRVAVLDAALAEGYRSGLVVRTTESFVGDESQATVPFTVSTDVWVVDWRLEPNEVRGEFTANVRSTQGDRLTDRITASGLLHESFEVLHSPGEYYLEIGLHPGFSFEVKIMEVDVLTASRNARSSGGTPSHEKERQETYNQRETTRRDVEKKQETYSQRETTRREKKEELDAYKQGETVNIGYTSYRVWGSRWSARLSDNQFLDQPPNAMYLIVDLTVRNDDKKSRMIPPFRLVDNNMAEYETSGKGWAVEGTIGVLDSLNPDVQKRGLVVFDVPPDRQYWLRISGGYWSGEKALILLTPR